MKKISFFKMNGAGNDFIVIDKNINPAFILDQNIIKKMCNRHYGIGADGIITVADSMQYDFDMEYFNADGSTGSLCGNGARCAIKFADYSGRIKQKSTKFLSNSILYSGEVIDKNDIKLFFNKPGKLNHNINIQANHQIIHAGFADTGSPHVVIRIENLLKDPNDPQSFFHNIDDVPVFEIGREIRYHKDFAPGGTNVNFIKLIEGKIYIRTYERGVENETLACGTGSTASAIIGCSLYNLIPPICLVTKGGDELIVNFNMQDQIVQNLSLAGPATMTFTGEFTLN